MTSFIRIPFMFVFHQSKRISAIKCILFYYRLTFPRVLLMYLCFLLLR